MKFVQCRAGFVLYSLVVVLCTLYRPGNGITLTFAQTLTPLAFSSEIYGTPVYLYNPASQSIVSPVGSGNQLTMVPWQDYNNGTMQWTITPNDSESTVYITAVSPQAAGCASGTSALWNAARLAPVTTLCSPDSPHYTNFIFISSGTKPHNYNILPSVDPGYCVTVVTNVPTIPTPVCNIHGPYTQWQLVTISPSL